MCIIRHNSYLVTIETKKQWIDTSYDVLIITSVKQGTVNLIVEGMT